MNYTLTYQFRVTTCCLRIHPKRLSWIWVKIKRFKRKRQINATFRCNVRCNIRVYIESLRGNYSQVSQFLKSRKIVYFLFYLNDQANRDNDRSAIRFGNVFRSPSKKLCFSLIRGSHAPNDRFKKGWCIGSRRGRGLKSQANLDHGYALAARRSSIIRQTLSPAIKVIKGPGTCNLTP